jgi:hypothetical protein
MSDDVIIPMLAIGMPIILVVTIQGFRFVSAQREMRHREHMRAMELGQPPSGGPPGTALVCTAIGAGVPIAACFFAMLVSMETRQEEVALIIWGGAMIISLAALFAGYRLALRLFFTNGGMDRYPNNLHSAHKPDISDPDLYDVVSRRG